MKKKKFSLPNKNKDQRSGIFSFFVFRFSFCTPEKRKKEEEMNSLKKINMDDLFAFYN